MLTASASAFLAALEASKLVAAAAVTDLSAWANEGSADGQAVAREVHRRSLLTPFQVKEVYRGRGADLTIGAYVLQDLLGEGGMGRVYKAHHTRMGRDVALKVIRKEKLSNPMTVKRFHQEVRAVAQLAHPNVVLAFDADEVNGNHFFAMEYIEGSDLTKIVKTRGPLPIAEACEYVRQAALGLQHAFEKGMVHRDVKPSNLFAAKGGQVKVLDLGLAMLNVTEEDHSRVTQDGFVIGTPDFLAPEQARDPQKVDIRADVYALGATLFYLLTGKVPYDGGNPTEKLMKHINDPPPNLLPLRPDAPPQLDALVKWFMAKKPDARPATPLLAAHALAPYCPPGTSATLPPLPAGSLSTPPPEEARSSQLFRLAADDGPAMKRARAVKQSPIPLGVIVAAIAVIAIGIGVSVLRKASAPPTMEAEYVNSLGHKFARVPPGLFILGSPNDETGRTSDEGPTAEVTLPSGYYMGTTEVTNAQFTTILGQSPSQTTVRAKFSSDLPVESVTWAEANEYCKKLNERDRTKSRGWAYRLPTEAEWEYACRATTATPFYFGPRLTLGKHATYTPDAADNRSDGDPKKAPSLPLRVGQTEANHFNLFDMHGNVAEWCSDPFAKYPLGPRTNPMGVSDGELRVVRGGSWKDPAKLCRSASRRGLKPEMRDDGVGFRVVLGRE